MILGRILLALLTLLPLIGLMGEEDFPSFCDSGSDLMHDLMIVECVNRMLNDQLPVTYNHYLQGGYLAMPSARVGAEGEIGIGYSSVPPYHNVNVRFQFSPDLELTGSYRTFRGVPDAILSPFGFGDRSDRGVNAKFVILHPSDSDYRLPGIAIGADDFVGTAAFRSHYVVATQVWRSWNLEVSLGYGKKRIKNFFGGASWMPWRQASCADFLRNISFVAEYDASDYRRDPHPEGRDFSTRVNIGIKERLWNCLDLSASWMRGEAFAFSASLFYNLGETDGLMPKLDDPLPYRAPINLQPIDCCLRPPDILVTDIAFAFQHHGLELLRASLVDEVCGGTTLRLVVYNTCYYWECMVREQVQALICNLIPANVDRVVVEIYEEGCSVQEYRFHSVFLDMFRNEEICAYELAIMAPLRDVAADSGCGEQVFYEKPRDWFCPYILPKTAFLFGSSRGKFKYALGISTGSDGFLAGGVYYRCTLGYIAFSDVPSEASQDRLNPSQLPNVQTDVLCYLRKGQVSLDEAFLQKNWNMGYGIFGKLATGLFNQVYGGVGGELLWYPVEQCWAIGVDAAYFRKRTVHGLGFDSRIRKLQGTRPTYIKFPLYQYFLDLHYSCYAAQLDFKVGAGRFLAGDHGARFDVCRNYYSGLRVFGWYTLTNAHDVINGKVYHDTGVGFSMPLDIFYTCSCRREWTNAIAAWLRDCGVRMPSGDGLYEMIKSARQ